MSFISNKVFSLYLVAALIGCTMAPNNQMTKRQILSFADSENSSFSFDPEDWFPAGTKETGNGTIKLWPKRSETGLPTVYYTFRAGRRQRRFKSAMRVALKMWTVDSCVATQEFGDEYSPPDDAPIVQFSDGTPTCANVLGRTGLMTFVFFNKGCKDKPFILRTVGNLLGIPNQFVRPDRDSNIKVFEENVDTRYVENVEKFNAGKMSTFDIPFDYTSIMQPNEFTYSINGNFTFATNDIKYQGLLGNATSVSFRDVLYLHKLYNCSELNLKLCNLTEDPCKNGGFTTPRDCSCYCSPHTSGKYCQEVMGDYYDHLIPQCSEDISEDTIIRTPEYPYVVPEGTWCVYKIRPTENRMTKITFKSFSLEKENDYICSERFQGIEDNCGEEHHCKGAFLEVRRGNLTKGEMYCGDDLNPNDTITTDEKEVTLYMNVRNRKSRGFLAEVQFLSTLNSLGNKQFNDNLTSSRGTQVTIANVIIHGIILFSVYWLNLS